MAQVRQPAERPRASWRRLFDPVDMAPLVYFRIIFGAILLWECWRYYDRGWIERYWVDKTFHFKYFGFSWVEPWPGTGMYWHFAAMAGLALCILLGYRYRLVAPLFFLAFTYVFLLDQATYLNHFYMISLVSFLMIFLPAHRAFSMDRARRPEIALETAPAWTLWTLRGQLGIVYFFGGVAKLNSDWLRGEPMRTWLAYETDFPLIGRFFTEEWMVYAMTYSGLLIDLLAAPALLWRRTRFPMLAVLILFHLMNAELFSIGIFPWFMIFATLIFLPASWFRVRWPAYEALRRERDAQRPARSAPAGRLARPAGILRPSPRTVALLLGAWFAVQILVPFRHFLYPGNVSWTEEGHRFAWHMKLRNKAASVQFIAIDPQTGWTRFINPADHLTERQAREMPGRPDMILQFAHYLEDKLRADGYEQLQVRASSQASLNGRRFQPLVDPDVDLAGVSRSLRPAPWIVPLREPLHPPDVSPAERAGGDAEPAAFVPE